jgi:transposase
MGSSGTIDAAKVAELERQLAVASLIGTCKLNGVNPEAYIATTLRKILDQHMQSDIDSLMAWNFGK